MTRKAFPDFLYKPVDEVAQLLLGCEFERYIDGTTVRVRIVETESYDQYDEASHAYGGEKKRNATMFKEAGHLYVYFTYGMHYCCNVVTGERGYGSGVLIRAVEPVVGSKILEKHRGVIGVNITNGPAKLCQALGIDASMNGHDLHKAPLKLLAGSLLRGETSGTSPRIGISKSQDKQRRHYIVDNPYVTRYRPNTP
jgi:DNA-3-methyladenine glycosylase